MNLLYVCTGNTCRSPMAEAVQKKIDRTMNVRSAGIYAHGGESINPYAKQVLQEKGISIHHESTTVTEELMEWADIVLTMTGSHKLLLSTYFPAYMDKCVTLMEYAKNKQNALKLETYDIEDPFGQSISVYRQTLAQIEKFISIISKE